MLCGRCNLPDLCGDTERLEQLLSNLCENALKYTAEGGRAELTATQVNGEIEIFVSDDGCGRLGQAGIRPLSAGHRCLLLGHQLSLINLLALLARYSSSGIMSRQMQVAAASSGKARPKASTISQLS